MGTPPPLLLLAAAVVPLVLLPPPLCSCGATAVAAAALQDHGGGRRLHQAPGVMPPCLARLGSYHRVCVREARPRPTEGVRLRLGFTADDAMVRGGGGSAPSQL